MAPLRERVLQFLHATAEEGQKSASQLLREVQIAFDNLNNAQWQLVKEVVSQFPTRAVPGAGAGREREHEDEGDDGLDTALGETVGEAAGKRSKQRCSLTSDLAELSRVEMDNRDVDAQCEIFDADYSNSSLKMNKLWKIAMN